MICHIPLHVATAWYYGMAEAAWVPGGRGALPSSPPRSRWSACSAPPCRAWRGRRRRRPGRRWRAPGRPTAAAASQAWVHSVNIHFFILYHTLWQKFSIPLFQIFFRKINLVSEFREKLKLLPSQLHEKRTSSLILKKYIEITNFEERTGGQPPQLPPPSPTTNHSDFFETSTMFFNPKRKLPFC